MAMNSSLRAGTPTWVTPAYVAGLVLAFWPRAYKDREHALAQEDEDEAYDVGRRDPRRGPRARLLGRARVPHDRLRSCARPLRRRGRRDPGSPPPPIEAASARQDRAARACEGRAQPADRGTRVAQEDEHEARDAGHAGLRRGPRTVFWASACSPPIGWLRAALRRGRRDRLVALTHAFDGRRRGRPRRTCAVGGAARWRSSRSAVCSGGRSSTLPRPQTRSKRVARDRRGVRARASPVRGGGHGGLGRSLGLGTVIADTFFAERALLPHAPRDCGSSGVASARR